MVVLAFPSGNTMFLGWLAFDPTCGSLITSKELFYNICMQIRCAFHYIGKASIQQTSEKVRVGN